MRTIIVSAALAMAAACGNSTTFTDAAGSGSNADARITADASDLDAATSDAASADAASADAASADAASDAGAAADAEPDTMLDPMSDAGADAAPDGGATGVVDPAPGYDTPGEYTGAGCPDSNQSSFTLSVGAASAYTFTGTITGNVGDGVFYVRGPNGETVGGPLETAANGSYAKTLPLFCGANIVKLVWNNGTCPLVLVYAVNRTTCVTADITATVQWDDLGRDWELHLIKPGGHINDNATDCTWTSCIGSSPDWGVVGDATDNPHKDIDNTGSYGPENIWLAGPETGTYTVMVEHWNSSGSPLSDGFVTLNVAGKSYTIAIQDLAPDHVWTAATIDWPSGVVTTSQAIHDCTANWSSGCRDAIP